jgi:parallel beta-helix repeat protein
MKKFFSLLLAIFFIGSSASATIINVPSSQPSIQAGINAASPGDTVLVQPGRYIENIDFKGKDIVVGSMFIATRDTSYISQTVIDAQQKNTVVAFQSGETSAAELCGLTLTNGHSQANATNTSGNIGGGIFCKNSSPHLHHLIVEGNLSELQGGGMYLENSNSVIEYCVIRNNRAVMDGGGICFSSSDRPSVNYTTISNNKAILGGGILCTGENNNFITIDHVLFFNNFISIYVGYSKVDIINCTIYNKFNAESIKSESAVLNVINSVIWTDYKWSISSYVDPQFKGSVIAVSHSDISLGEGSIAKGSQDSLYWLGGNIASDPLFKDAAHDNFSLQRFSPCVDAGTSSFSFKNRTIVNLNEDQYKGTNPDIGAFEFTFPNKVAQNSIKNISIFPNYPNPFNESTLITFYLYEQNNLSLRIYNSNGQLVKSLFEGFSPAGIHKIVWNGNNESTGIYFLKLNTKNITQTIKMLLIK